MHVSMRRSTRHRPYSSVSICPASWTHRYGSSCYQGRERNGQDEEGEGRVLFRSHSHVDRRATGRKDRLGRRCHTEEPVRNGTRRLEINKRRSSCGEYPDIAASSGRPHQPGEKAEVLRLEGLRLYVNCSPSRERPAMNSIAVWCGDHHPVHRYNGLRERADCNHGRTAS